MRLLRKLRFIRKFDIEPGFYVYHTAEKQFLWFRTSAEAFNFSTSSEQPQYRPQVMVSLRRIL